MKAAKQTFFSSDWHCGHAKSIEFDARPFRDLDHMHEVLVNNYNSTVTPSGICYFLGDMSNQQASEFYKIVSRLNGTKILILGNHDRGVQWGYASGFDAVMYSASLVIAERIVTLTHCPLRGVPREECVNMRGYQPGDNWHGEHKNGRFSLPDFGQMHLHGHIHSRPDKPGSKKIDGRQFDVGCVANNYRPVSQSVIESWVAKYGR